MQYIRLFSKGIKILLFFIIPFNCLSEVKSNKTDSLFSVLRKQKEDTNKVNTLNNLSVELTGKNPDTAMFLSNNAYTLAVKLKYESGKISALCNISNIYRDKGDFDLVIK